MSCLARIVNWDTSSQEVFPGQKIGYISLCSNDCVKGEVLCAECSKGEKKNQYGLITQPIPKLARIYGSPLYLKLLKHMDGITNPPKWMEAAEAAQAAAEERCQRMGLKAWTLEDGFKLDETLRSSKMPPKKLEKPSAKELTMMKTFTAVKTIYTETATQPEQVETDEVGIEKKKIQGKDVWITKTKDIQYVFSIGDDGEPDELLGCLEDDCIVDLENNHI